MQRGKQKIGEKIKFLRKNKLNITQSELAELVGISKSFMSDIENQRTYPSVKTLDKLAKILDVSIDYFFTEEEIEKTKIIHTKENEIEKVNILNKLIKNLIEEKIIIDENNISDDVFNLIMNAIKIQIKLEKEKMKK